MNRNNFIIESGGCTEVVKFGFGEGYGGSGGDGTGQDDLCRVFGHQNSEDVSANGPPCDEGVAPLLDGRDLRRQLIASAGRTLRHFAARGAGKDANRLCRQDLREGTVFLSKIKRIEAVL